MSGRDYRGAPGYRGNPGGGGYRDYRDDRGAPGDRGYRGNPGGGGYRDYRDDRGSYRGDTGSYRGAPGGGGYAHIGNATAKKFAYAIIHFGNNPVYLELEMYFFRMLRQYTQHDIIYLYSESDTPESFVDAIRPLVTKVVPYDDRKITFDVEFKSGYANFNTLRTCNFIFAYTLTQYDTVCIIESDMVIMKPLDSIFALNAPAILTYHIGNRKIKFNTDKIINNPSVVIAECKNMGRLNGGVMLIHPSMHMFHKYLSKIQDVVKHECKYPNETLFEYVNEFHYNLPIQYNLSHFYAKTHKLAKYGLNLSDIYVYHFNETKYKHLDIIKNPLDEMGNNWLDIINTNEKYEIKKFPIMHYKVSIYDKHHPEIRTTIEAIESKMQGKKIIAKPRSPEDSPPPLPPVMLAKPRSPEDSPPPLPTVMLPKPRSPEDSPPPLPPVMLPKYRSPEDSPPPLPTVMLPKHRSPEDSPHPLPKQHSSPKEIIQEILESFEQVKKSSSGSSSQGSRKKSKCPKGTRRNKKTGICEPHEKKSKCPKGTRRNKKTGLCEPTNKNVE